MRRLPTTPPEPEAAGTADFWAQPAPAVLATLKSTPDGLPTDEAAARLLRYGPNTRRESRRLSWPRLLLRQFSSPLVAILVVGGLLSLAVGQWSDAGMVLAIVAATAVLGFAQEYRASAAMEALRRRLALTATVLRDGSPQRLPATDIVPGDIVLLAAGNLVVADGLLLEARDLMVEEAVLTGESFPAEKLPGQVDAVAPMSGRSNCVFQGTSVRSGTGRVLAVHTGGATAFSQIAGRLDRREPESEFARGVRRFGLMLLRVMLVMVTLVLVANIALHRPVIDSLLFAVALAIGLSPELLPAIVTTTLAAGARRMARRGVIVRRLEAIEGLGGMNVLCTDKTGTLTTGVTALAATVDAAGAPSEAVGRLAYLNAAFETGMENPLDQAILAAGAKAGWSAEGWSKRDELPYDFQRRRLTILAADEGSDTLRLVTKGAFDSVLTLCTAIATGAGTAPLDEDGRQRLGAYYAAQGADGYRVLAVATRDLPAATLRPEDEAALTFQGFLLFQDEIKADTADTIRSLRDLGIAVKVISGDNRHVAAHVARQIGLDPLSLLSGADLAAMTDESLWHEAAETQLFVEVDPQQKERIVRALQRTGHTVGFLGDGINDAPALFAADIGISVESAADVAREAADIVLLSRDLGTIRDGVLFGRRTFANTLKYIRITTSASFGNIITMAAGVLYLPFLPMAARQILLTNLVSDLPAMTISTDRVDAESLDTVQRWALRDLVRFMIVFGLVSSVFDLLTFTLLLFVFSAGESLFQTGWFVVSLLTELAVLLILRSSRPLFSSAPAPLLLWATLVTALVAVALPYVPGLAEAFGFVALPWPVLVMAVVVVAAYAVATEAAKRIYFRRTDSR